jgi:ADP-heptose:LPS heptosyltransferase
MSRPNEKIIPGSHKIILTHHRAAGDCLMFSSMLRDLKLLFPHLEIGFNCSFNELLEGHPYTNVLNPDDPDVSVISTGNSFINACDKGHHMSFDFLWYTIYKLAGYGIIDGTLTSLYKKLQDPILAKQGFMSNRPCINITKKEKEIKWIEDAYNIKRYWIVAAGGKHDFQTKIWGWSLFQDVIDYFDGFIKFVIIGKSGHILNMNLKNCIYLTDKTSLRDLYHLSYHADGAISGISFLMHLAGGLKNYKGIWLPCVNIKGAREQPSYTLYENHQVLHTYGSFDCAGCWKGKVTEDQKIKDDDRICKYPSYIGDDGRKDVVPDCMAKITASDIIRAIQIYYQGDIYQGAIDKYKKIKKLRDNYLEPIKDRLYKLKNIRKNLKNI